MYEAASSSSLDDITLKKGFMQFLKDKIGNIEDMGNGRTYPAPILQTEHFKVHYKCNVEKGEVEECVRQILDMTGGWRPADAEENARLDAMTFFSPDGKKRKTVEIEHYDDETYIAVFDMQ
ncbi:MAG: hypothetical protein NTU57_03160 [Candidatus Aenigmarchaeota archaeon]|nr:hypothetical protein [Candidatus Aenigmarchaeota archaeon]